MAKKDLIISFFANSPGLKSALSALEDPFVFFQPQIADRKYKEFVQGAGNSVLGIWNMAKKPGDDLGRVAVLGFSEGAMGVRAVLETSDASAIDAVIPCDGIHTQKLPGGLLEMSKLAPFISYAKMAASVPPSKNPNVKLLCITHSAIVPQFASATETASVIWVEATKGLDEVESQNCGWPCPAAIHESALNSIVYPGGWTSVRPSGPATNFLPPAPFTWTGFSDGWTQRLIANNLYVFGWSYPTKNQTKDPTGNRDHVFQAEMVLPAVTKELLVSRWNGVCGPMMGLGAETCVKAGRGYFDQEAKPLENPFPLGVPLPKSPIQCPSPPPGKTIVGQPGDPCWIGSESIPFHSKSQAANWMMAIGGAAIGYFGVSFYVRSKGRRG